MARRRARRGPRHRGDARAPARRHARSSPTPNATRPNASSAGSIADWHAARDAHARRTLVGAALRRAARAARRRGRASALHALGAPRATRGAPGGRAPAVEEAANAPSTTSATTPPDDALHAVRIRAKRARYAAEATIPVFGKPRAKFAERDRRGAGRARRAPGRGRRAHVARQDRERMRRRSRRSPRGCSPSGETDAADAARAGFPACGRRRATPKLRAWL